MKTITPESANQKYNKTYKEKNKEELKRKNKWTIGIIEKKYNIKLSGRSDMLISTYLKRKGFTSLSKLLTGKR